VSRGLGKDPNSYAVGSKLPPPRPPMDFHRALRHGKITSGIGLSRRGFMQRTKVGLAMRKFMEGMFWLFVGGTVFFLGAVPLIVWASNHVWTWALT
jgi:hypothetical protein